MGGDDVVAFIVMLIGGGIGGFIGGLLAGLFTMLALRPNAPSISWKHMSPTIRIWAISGPLGMLVSGLITYLLIALGTIGLGNAEPDCSGGLGECVGQIIGTTIGNVLVFALLALLVFFLFVIAAWFLTGMFTGGLAVRHIRRLEPGITSSQSRRVSLGWGCGAILAAIVTLIFTGILLNALGL